jgi:archaellum component FlaC
LEVLELTNEEFQNTILAELRDLNTELRYLNQTTNNRFDLVDLRLGKVEQRLDKLDRKMDNVYEQTANLLEFRTEVIEKLDSISSDQRSIMGVLGEHEIAIRTLQRRPAL